MSLSSKGGKDKFIKSFAQVLINFGLGSSVIYAIALAIEIYGLSAFQGPLLFHAFACLFLMPFGVFGLIYNIYFMIRGCRIYKRGASDRHVYRTATIAMITQFLQLGFSAFLIIATFTGDFVAIFRELFVEMIYLIFLCVSYGIFCAYLVRTRTILHVLSRI